MAKEQENILISEYKTKEELIKKRLEEFSTLPKEKYFQEFIFCILTPQSNAKQCWNAVEQLLKLENWSPSTISKILQTQTRFHNNKTIYLLEARNIWQEIEKDLQNTNSKELRNQLAEKVKGYGLKEASHFLRNIGKSNNEIAILDRHILRNLKTLDIISEDRIKNKAHYLKIEDEFIQFSQEIRIPLDELDLLFWSRENGEIFK